MSMVLILVMVSQMYTYPQTHQVVYIKYLCFFTCYSYLSKVVKKMHGLGQAAQLVGASPCAPRGCWFYYRSGRISRLWV